jgi:cytochrome c551/c552
VIRPIAQQQACAACHGPVDRISPAVRAVLAQRYPADSAVGFAEGDIRGWYWVEMPKPGR